MNKPKDVTEPLYVHTPRKLEWSDAVMVKMQTMPRAHKESPLKEWWKEQQAKKKEGICGPK